MVTHQLDEIATTVGTHLLQANSVTPSHDTLSAVKELSLSSSVILEAMNKVLYTEMKFSGNSDDYYNPHNSYIDKVQKWFHNLIRLKALIAEHETSVLTLF